MNNNDPLGRIQDAVRPLLGDLRPLLGELPEMFDFFTGREAPAETQVPFETFRENNDFVLRAELPGVPRENVEINLARGFLTVRGEKQAQEVGVDRVTSRRYGPFLLTHRLPQSVLPAAVEATFKDGVLTVRVHNAYADETVRIRVN